MEIRELKALQQQAINVFTKFHQVDFDNAEEVLNFLYEIHPYMTDINLNLPKEQLFRLLSRHGYGEYVVETESRVQQLIRNLMIDMEVEEVLNWAIMKSSKSLYSQIIH